MHEVDVPATPFTALIVDDDHWAARGVRAALARVAEVSVTGVAHSGEEAITAFRNEPADLVLMDIDLDSGMTGIELTREILKLHPDTQVVIHTATAPGPAIARALAAGATACLRKDLSEAALIAALKAAVQGTRLTFSAGARLSDSTSEQASPSVPHTLPVLTPTEREILGMICRGLGYREIAERQGVSVNTVETHAKRLRKKLGANTLAQLVCRAFKYRFVLA